MAAALMILLQASTPVPSASPIGDFDLRRIPPDYDLQPAPSGRCAADHDPTVIVVCGSRTDGRYRLRPLPDKVETGPPLAATSLGEGVTGAVELDSATMPNGMASKRIMVTITTTF